MLSMKITLIGLSCSGVVTLSFLQTKKKSSSTLQEEKAGVKESTGGQDDDQVLIEDL